MLCTNESLSLREIIYTHTSHPPHTPVRPELFQQYGDRLAYDTHIKSTSGSHCVHVQMIHLHPRELHVPPPHTALILRFSRQTDGTLIFSLFSLGKIVFMLVQTSYVFLSVPLLLIAGTQQNMLPNPCHETIMSACIARTRQSILPTDCLMTAISKVVARCEYLAKFCRLSANSV